MTAAFVNGITIEYEEHGPADGEPVPHPDGRALTGVCTGVSFEVERWGTAHRPSGG